MVCVGCSRGRKTASSQDWNVGDDTDLRFRAGHSFTGRGAVVDEEALAGLNGGLSHMGLTAVGRARDRRIRDVGLKEDEDGETRQPLNDPPKAGKGRDVTWPSSHRGRVVR